jgi:hypothetical protein
MKTNKLCEALLHDICNENILFYNEMLTSVDLDSIKNAQWKSIISLARELDLSQREVLLSFARLATIDAISSICGMIDGTTQLNNEFVAFSLTDESGTEHAGSLQDAFLSASNK